MNDSTKKHERERVASITLSSSETMPKATERPSVIIGDPIKTANWTNGLFGCFSNVGLCALTFIAPCVTFGRLAAVFGDDCRCFGAMYMIPGVNCYLESDYREKIRNKRGIMDSKLMDVLSIVLCPLCALTQEAMEVYAIQVDELRIGAIAGGAPPDAFPDFGLNVVTTQPAKPPPTLDDSSS